MLTPTRILSAQIPAGTYAIGDPCLLLSDSESDELFLSTHNPDTLIRTFASDLRLILLESPGGDGWLTDDQGGSYAIDSGNLAVMPLSDPVPLRIVKYAARELIQIHEFENEAMVTSAGKVLKVAGLTIKRDGPDLF